MKFKTAEHIAIVKNGGTYSIQLTGLTHGRTYFILYCGGTAAHYYCGILISSWSGAMVDLAKTGITCAVTSQYNNGSVTIQFTNNTAYDAEGSYTIIG